MSAREELEKHAGELLENTGIKAEIVEEQNRIFVILTKVPLPAGCANVACTDVLFITDTQYPLSAMDMFYTEVEVVRANGTPFENSESIEEYCGRKWRRFSYHRNAPWKPGGNPLLDHFALMETRWTAKAKR